MSDARQLILSSIRRGIGRDDDAPDAAAAYHSELDEFRNPRPDWRGEQRIDRFCRQLERASATAETLTGIHAIPKAIERYLGDNQLQRGQIDVAPNHRFADLEWPSEWDVHVGKPRHDSLMGLSWARCGIAETGTLMLLSGSESPVSLNFLPDYHFVALAREDVIDYLEDAWAMGREEADFPPRTLNLITGPSRTADVEQTLQIGAHGPRRLHILLIDRTSG